MISFTNVVNVHKQIRQSIRYRRHSLTIEQQYQFAEQAALRFLYWLSFLKVYTIALFLSFDGEIDTYPLIQQLWNTKKQVYLPVLHPFIQNNLLFIRYHPYTKLVINTLNFYEPKFNTQDILILNKLDVMVVPLVAFDIEGHRLGLGGGFYDRILQNWQQRGFYPVGYAHDCQLVNVFPVHKWDISLPAIITPSKIWIW